jgi:hypothetical protein
MLDIPKWLINLLPNIKCCVCKEKAMVPENIVALGIRKSIKDINRTVFFFDYACKCGRNSIIEFPDQMNIEGFVNMMVDEYISDGENECQEHSPDCKHHPDNINKGKNKNFQQIKSKISEKEVGELKQLLNECKDFPSFLSQIGVSQELINIKKKSNK